MEIKYISKDGKSNKIWTHELLDGNRVRIRYGRLGLNLRTVDHDFRSSNEAQAFIQKKVAEKTRDVPGKRYVKVDDEKATEETRTARTIGHQWRVSGTAWVGLRNNRLRKLGSYDPDEAVRVKLDGAWGRGSVELLLWKDRTEEIKTYGDAVLERRSADPDLSGRVRRYLLGLLARVQKACVRIEQRMLDLGGDRPADWTDRLYAELADDSVDRSTVETLSGVGMRKLLL